MNMISYGLSYGWPSPSLPKLFAPDSPIKITSSQGSWFSVMPFVGSLVGAPTAAVLTNIFGRKIMLLLTSIPYTVSWLIIACFESIETFMIARALAGVGGGGLIVALPIYVAEVTEPEVRGQLTAWFTAMSNLGVLLMFCSGPFLTIKAVAFAAVSVPILFVLSFIWMPESPYFHMLKGRKEEAKRILTIFRGDEDVDQIVADIEEHLSMTTNWMDIFKYASNRKAILLIVTMILTQEYSGRSPFIFYSQIVFQGADKNIPAAYVSIGLAIIQLTSSVTASFIVDKFGRKPLLYFSLIGSMLCSITEGTYFFFKYYMQYNMEKIKWLPVISLLLYIVIFNFGLGIMPVIFAGELLATNVKSSGMCVVDIFDSLIVISASKFFQITKDAIGVFAPFWTFAVCDILGIVFVFKCLPETKGLSLEEIQKILKPTQLT